MVKPQTKEARWSTTKRWYFHGRYRRSISVTWIFHRAII